MKLVYWEQNGEVRVREITYAEISSAEILVSWIGFERYSTGRWRYSLRRIGKKYYLMREWVPAPGLAWDEVEVYEVGVE